LQQLLVVHVGAGVDTFRWELGKGNLEALLNRLENNLVIRAADEGDTETLGSETTSTTDAVKVRISLVGHVVVDGDVDALNINSATKDVSRDTDASLEVLELLVAFDTFFLLDTGVDSGTGEVALAQKVVELLASLGRANEDDDLVELQLIKEVVELPVLLTLVKLHVVLLQTVKGQLLLVVNVDLERVLHELLAGLADLLCQGGGEHHHLLVSGCGAEDGLHIVAHVGLVKHLVALIEDEVLQIGEAEVPVADESVDTAGGTDNNVGVRVLVAKKLDVRLNGCSAVEDTNPDIGQELGETVVLVPDLVGQLTSVAHDQNGGDTRLGLLVHLLQGSEDEDGCLSETGLGLAENVVTEDGLRNGNLLDLGRMFEATVRNRSHKLVLQEKVTEAGRMNADIAAFFVAGSLARCEAALSCRSGAVGRRLGGLDLLVGVVDEVLLVRHDD